jgi:peroxiredoxin
MTFRCDLTRVTLVATLAFSGLLAACHSETKSEPKPVQPAKTPTAATTPAKTTTPTTPSTTTTTSKATTPTTPTTPSTTNPTTPTNPATPTNPTTPSTTTPKPTTPTTPATTTPSTSTATGTQSTGTTGQTGTTTPKPTSTTGAAAGTAAAATTSTGPAKINSPAPDFTLTDTSGKQVSLNEFTKQGKVVVLEWFNPDCPVSKSYHTNTDPMGTTANSYAGKNVAWIAINSGAPGMQGAGKDRNAKAVTEYNIKYPVLLDETGKVGRMYGAKTTPHMFVIDKNGVLRYMGAIDDGSANAMGQTNYVKQALDQLLANQPVSKSETQAFGCSVKYATE